jgi:Niemann-Pick C1 protein
MVLNANGDLTASRVTIFMENISAEDVTDQINALKNQRRITAAQPINQGKSDWDFFTFDGTYYIWEFFSVVSDELLLTAILGVVAVSVISFLFIPHWSAVLFVLPIITILYVELMGFLQICGASINPVSYISLVMAIGLLVDFLVHTVLKYFESTEKGDDAKATRDAKTTDMLCTMGASLLIGGISTALGVVPLAFSTSEIFSTVFITFIGLVLLGLSHGLVLLPVLLSLVGPTVSISSIKGPPSEIKTADRQETALSLEDIASDDTSAVNEKPELVVEELDPEFDV